MWSSRRIIHILYPGRMLLLKQRLCLVKCFHPDKGFWPRKKYATCKWLLIKMWLLPSYGRKLLPNQGLCPDGGLVKLQASATETLSQQASANKSNLSEAFSLLPVLSDHITHNELQLERLKQPYISISVWERKKMCVLQHNVFVIETHASQAYTPLQHLSGSINNPLS